ncbi:MAG: endonuclease V [Thermoplasmata archaeon]
MALPASLRDIPDMWKETYGLVAQVPTGKVTTYGEVAKALGDIVASRFVGLAMSMNDDIVRVPCRRVVQSDGFVGGYTGGGPSKKARLLRHEGVEVVGLKVVNLYRYLFSEKDFESSYPLRRLKARQLSLKRRLDTSASENAFQKVAGVDVAYDGDRAFAAMVLFDFETGEEIGRTVVEGVAKFPYIPTYLAFREIPVIAPLMARLERDTVVMYDGNGILHPEGLGITSQVGILYDVPTIGVAKKLLCGSVVGRPGSSIARVVEGGRTIGHAVARAGELGAKPVYVSAGHGLSSEQAVSIAVRFMRHRVPEPTRQAHIAAEAARRAAASNTSARSR